MILIIVSISLGEREWMIDDVQAHKRLGRLRRDPGPPLPPLFRLVHYYIGTKLHVY